MPQRMFGQVMGRDWLRGLGSWKSDVCVYLHCEVERKAGGIILQASNHTRK